MDELFEGAEKKKKRSAKQHGNDVLFDPLARFFFPSGVGPDDAKRVMKVVKNLRAKNATVEQVGVTIAAWGAVFPYCSDALSLEALNKHWDKLLMNGHRTKTPKPRRNEGIENEAEDFVYLRALAKWKLENGG